MADLKTICLDGNCMDVSIFDAIYPVGSIYMSANDVNPATLFGGTWEAIQDRFVLAKGSTYPTLGATGGSATHTLTTAEMPSHTHTQNAHSHTQNAHKHTQDAHLHGVLYSDSADGRFMVSKSSPTPSNINVSDTGGSYKVLAYSSGNTFGTRTNTKNTTPTEQNATATNQNTTATNQNTGGGGSHNNMPPYIVVNVWKRTA